MPLLDWEKFRRADGFIDWAAVAQQERNNGERCMRCNRFIIFGRGGGPALCDDCERLDNDPGTVEHQMLIRCPSCRKQVRIFEDGEALSDDLFYEGEHGLYCQHCGHEFEVSTRVEYFFTSPKLDTRRAAGAEEENPDGHE